jgi:hypothetical protein
VVHERPDRPLTLDQRIEDLSAVGFGDRVEDVGRRGGTGYSANIFL